MRRTKGFDYCVTRSRPSFSLESLLEHRLVISLRRRQRVRACQLVSQGVTNKTRCGFQTAIQKDRTGDRFKHVRQQSILLPATTLLFSTSEAQKLAQLQSLGSIGQRRSTHETMLHARQFTLGAAGI